MKRIILLVTLAVVILSLVTAFAVTAFAAEENITDSGTCGENLTWVFDESTATLTVSGTGSTKDCGEFIYESSSVTATRGDMMPWFNKNYTWKKVKKVVIGEGVTRIGDGIFTRMPILEEVVLPSTLVTIGVRAFELNPKLKTVEFPDGLVEIEERAFRECRAITEVYLPDSVKTLGQSAFSSCSSLQKLRLSENLTEIPNFCFGSANLHELNLPNGIKKIGYGAFYGDFEEVVLPEGLEELGRHSIFSIQGKIREVTLPKSLRVFDQPFYYLTLEEIHVDPENPYFRIEENCLIENETGILHWGKNATSIPKNITGFGEDAFLGAENLVRAEIPEGVTGITNGLFINCLNLAYVYIPSTLTELDRRWFVIGDDEVATPSLTIEVHPDNERYAVWGRSLVDLETKTLRYHQVEDPIPEGIEEIAEYCLYGDIEELVIPEGVKRLQWDIYGKPTDSVKRVILPKSIEKISDDAFYGYSALKDIYYQGTREEWERIDFEWIKYNNWLEGKTVHFADDPIESETEAATTSEPTVSETDPAPQKSGCGGVVTAPIAVLLVIPALALRKRKGKGY